MAADRECRCCKGKNEEFLPYEIRQKRSTNYPFKKITEKFFHYRDDEGEGIFLKLEDQF
jgi:hypothetical protein